MLDLLANQSIREVLPEASGDEIAGQASLMLKIDLLVAFSAVPRDLRPVFSKFNAIRNRFAHEHQASFDEGDATDLFNVVPNHYRSSFRLEYRTNPSYVLSRVAGLLYGHLEGGLERLRDGKVAHAVWQQMIEQVVLPEDQWTESVRRGDSERKSKVESEVLAARRARREKGEI
jgi:hypothetical protein